MTVSINTPTYDDQWGPVSRRVRRASRYCRYLAKSSLGLGPRVLVEMKWRLGDEIMALPIYEAIKARYPAAHLEVLCNYPELLEGNPFVNAVNPSGPSPDLYYLLRGVHRNVYRLEHYARQADVPLPHARPRLYYPNWNSPLLNDLPPGDGPLVAIAPGASWETKRWPADRWRNLNAGLSERDCRVITLGAEGEFVGTGVDFTGRTSVRDAAVLLHHADLVVSNDSGLMHLGLAAGTPVVALFGATDPGILIRDEPALRSLTNGRDCEGCWNGAMTMKEPGVCPLGVSVCLDPITVGRVLEQVDTVLSARG